MLVAGEHQHPHQLAVFEDGDQGGVLNPAQRVTELRLETVFPAERHDDIVAALRAAHPYEEPAFDVYELVS